MRRWLGVVLASALFGAAMLGLAPPVSAAGDPFVGMWAPNVLLFLVGVYLFVHAEKETPYAEWHWVRSSWDRLGRIFSRHEDTR